MQRTLILALTLSLSANASADCDLRYAPPDVRAAALAFHHRASERRPISADRAMRVPRVPHADRPTEIAKRDPTPSR
jgi:hypothetical protein